jgi:DNA-binding MarR family transcriptional regulator
MDFAEISDWIFENIQTLFFPEELVSLDMKLSKIELISLLFVDRKHEVIMSSLADYLNVSMSTATGIADRLNRQGLLERTRSEADRRIVSLSLSPAGREITERIASAVNGYLEIASGALSDEEQGQLTRLIMKILAAFQKSAGAPRREPEPAENTLTRIRID